MADFIVPEAADQRTQDLHPDAHEAQWSRRTLQLQSSLRAQQPLQQYKPCQSQEALQRPDTSSFK